MFDTKFQTFTKAMDEKKKQIDELEATLKEREQQHNEIIIDRQNLAQENQRLRREHQTSETKIKTLTKEEDEKERENNAEAVNSTNCRE